MYIVVYTLQQTDYPRNTLESFWERRETTIHFAILSMQNRLKTNMN